MQKVNYNMRVKPGNLIPITDGATKMKRNIIRPKSRTSRYKSQKGALKIIGLRYYTNHAD